LRDDERLAVTNQIVAADGATRPLLPCIFPHYRNDGIELSAFAQPPTINGWVANLNAVTNPISWLSANWTVPANPNTTGQTIYFFPGVEPAATYDTSLFKRVRASGNGNEHVIVHRTISSLEVGRLSGARFGAVRRLAQLRQQLRNAP
jgi:hypothetical protein